MIDLSFHANSILNDILPAWSIAEREVLKLSALSLGLSDFLFSPVSFHFADDFISLDVCEKMLFLLEEFTPQSLLNVPLNHLFQVHFSKIPLDILKYLLCLQTVHI